MNSFTANLPILWSAALWRACWQGALAIAMVYLVCRLAPRIPPAIQCWLWRAAYLKVLVSLLWSATVNLPILRPTTIIAIETPRFDLLTDDSSQQAVSAAFASNSLPILAAWAALLLWSLGVAWSVWRLCREVQEVRRLRQSCRGVDDPDLNSECASIAGRMGLKRPDLLEHEGPAVPVLIGLNRSAIVVPTCFRNDYNPAQRRMILAHELAHLKRGDLRWAWLARATRCILFFHPLVWLAENEWQQSQEMACDQEVLRLEDVARSSYGAILLEIVQQKRSLLPAGLAVMQVVESYSTVRRRLMAMKQSYISSRSRMVATFVVAAVACAIAFMPWRVVAQESKVQGVEVAFTLGPGDLASSKLADFLQLTPIQQSKVRAIQQSTISQIRRTLTPQQAQRLDQMATKSHESGVTVALTSEQQQKMAKVKLQMAQQVHAIDSDASLTPQQKEERMRALKLEHEQVFHAILTPQQIDQVKRAQSMKVGAMPSLSPEQEQRLRELKLQFGESVQRIESDASLSPQEKKERLEQLHRDLEAVMHQILSPDQLHQMHQHMAIGLTMPFNGAAMDELGLTGAQNQRLAAIQTQAHRQLMSILTPAQKERLATIHK